MFSLYERSRDLITNKEVQERSAILCSHIEIMIRTTALLKKFERHSNHLL